MANFGISMPLEKRIGDYQKAVVVTPENGDIELILIRQNAEGFLVAEDCLKTLLSRDEEWTVWVPLVDRETVREKRSYVRKQIAEGELEDDTNPDDLMVATDIVTTDEWGRILYRGFLRLSQLDLTGEIKPRHTVPDRQLTGWEPEPEH